MSRAGAGSRRRTWPTLQKVLYLVLRYSSHQHYLGMGTDQVIIPRYKVQEGTDQVEIPRYKVRVKSKYLGTRYIKVRAKSKYLGTRYIKVRLKSK